jgi:hypothetical protein
MHAMAPKRNGENSPRSQIGTWLAIGAGVGAAFFAATDSPVWIGVGAAIGATRSSGGGPS